MKKAKITVVIASGYFNPLHKGHVEYLDKASELGEELYVIVNSDYQVGLKGSKPFMNQNERRLIVEGLRSVLGTMISRDKDGSVCKSIEQIVRAFSNSNPNFDIQFIFAKGGDRRKGNIPETAICKKLGVKIVDGLGKKIQSSSELLKNVRHKNS